MLQSYGVVERACGCSVPSQGIVTQLFFCTCSLPPFGQFKLPTMLLRVLQRSSLVFSSCSFSMRHSLTVSFYWLARAVASCLHGATFDLSHEPLDQKKVRKLLRGPLACVATPFAHMTQATKRSCTCTCAQHQKMEWSTPEGAPRDVTRRLKLTQQRCSVLAPLVPGSAIAHAGYAHAGCMSSGAGCETRTIYYFIFQASKQVA